MKVLVVYDSVSSAKITAKVAEAVAAGMKESGASVDSYYIDDASKANIKDYDALVLGAPTMAWRPSAKMKTYLSGLKGQNFPGKVAASFDTQMKSSISGNANKHMDKVLAEAGFKVGAPLLAYVKSENKQYQLLDGEMEKAKAWGREFAKKTL